MNYFVLQVHTCGEENFRKRFNFSTVQNGIDVFALPPSRTLDIRQKGRVKEKNSSLFPGYVFMECDAVSPELYTIASGCVGFIRFFPENSCSLPLPENEKQFLKKITANGEIIAKSGVVFDENNRIRVINGPLAGMEGRIIRVNKRKGRARVRLSLYQNTFGIDFGFEDLSIQDRAKDG